MTSTALSHSPHLDTGAELSAGAEVIELSTRQNLHRRSVSARQTDESLLSPAVLRGWLVQSLLLEAITSDGLGDAAAAEDALERALDIAEHDRVLVPFLVHPVPTLLNRYVGLRAAHATLVAEIFNLLVGRGPGSLLSESEPLREPLTESETRVLRLLSTDLSKREIASELYVSLNTIKTHVKHLYAKLDVQTRPQAVDRARRLGLLTYSSRAR